MWPFKEKYKPGKEDMLHFPEKLVLGKRSCSNSRSIIPILRMDCKEAMCLCNVDHVPTMMESPCDELEPNYYLMSIERFKPRETSELVSFNSHSIIISPVLSNFLAIFIIGSRDRHSWGVMLWILSPWTPCLLCSSSVCLGPFHPLEGYPPPLPGVVNALLIMIDNAGLLQHTAWTWLP